MSSKQALRELRKRVSDWRLHKSPNKLDDHVPR